MKTIYYPIAFISFVLTFVWLYVSGFFKLLFLKAKLFVTKIL
jgi:hypothetical protein